MRIKILLACALLFCSAAQAQLRAPKKIASLQNTATAAGNELANILPIKRVIVYSNGVVYIERRGVISGDAEINLSFKQSQVDDVLKSMVVLDLGQGKIGAVSYNSSAPPSAKMAEIPFSVDAVTDGATGGLAGVLAQLQGAKVSVATSTKAASGSILTIEKREVPAEKDVPARSARFLVIAGDGGEISSFDLAEVRSLKLLENGTVKDVSEFANAAALARRRDAKTITVTSSGSGQREMMVSYITAAPIWKTNYRVVMDDEGKPFFQGWAIVDNVSDEDWRGVQLSLVSGTPISFIQPIQQPFFRYRPVVPIPGDLKLSPQVYEPEGTVTGDAVGEDRAMLRTEKDDSRRLSQQQINNLPLNGRDFRSMVQLQPGTAVVAGRAENESTFGNAITSGNSGVETAATGDEIGDLFEYKIAQPITVLRDRSALIPIVQTKMEGERVSVYNEAVRRDRPLGGMRLVNTTALTLEGGALTVLDGNAYAGEALMERLKPKEQRFISYALDLGTLVTVRQDSDSLPAKLIKILNGTFQVNYFRQERKTYTLQNQTEHARIVYIEHPVRQGWQLSDDTPKPDITTQRFYRYKVELPAYEKKEITISEQQSLMENYALTNLSRADLELFLSRRYINADIKQRLEKLIDLRGQISQIDARLQGFRTEEAKINDDQKRLRDNIETLSKTPEAKTLIARYIAKANDQETRLEAIETERKTLEAEKQRLEAELAAAIRAFNV